MISFHRQTNKEKIDFNSYSNIITTYANTNTCQNFLDKSKAERKIRGKTLKQGSDITNITSFQDAF